MKTIIQSPLLLGLLLALSACSSNEKKSDPASPSVNCTCGSPEAAFDGCPHPLCLSGEGNPDNPECVCGPLSFDDTE